MTAPALAVQVNGVGVVTADNYNTFLQSCNIATDLRGFQGTTGIQVYMRGYSAVGDGGQGMFYWNAGATAADDNGVTTIKPSSSTAGVWTRISVVAVTPYSLLVPTNGFSTTIITGISQLILNPAGTLASGTVQMPLVALNGQTVKISTTQTITTLTFSANVGQTIVDAPSTLLLNTSASFIYVRPSLTWYLV